MMGIENYIFHWMQQLFQDLCCPFFFAGFDKCQLHDSLQLPNPTGGGVHRLRSSHQKNTRSFQWVKIYRVLDVSILFANTISKVTTNWRPNYFPTQFSIALVTTLHKSYLHSSVHCSTRPRALIVRYFRQMQSNEHAMMQSNTDLEHRFVYVS